MQSQEHDVPQALLQSSSPLAAPRAAAPPAPCRGATVSTVPCPRTAPAAGFSVSGHGLMSRPRWQAGAWAAPSCCCVTVQAAERCPANCGASGHCGGTPAAFGRLLPCFKDHADNGRRAAGGGHAAAPGVLGYPSTLNKNGRSMPKRSVASSPSACGCAASQPLSVWPLPATRDGAVGCVPILQRDWAAVVPQSSLTRSMQLSRFRVGA